MAGMSVGEGRIVDDAVEQRLHALVLEGRAAEHREELDVDRALADQRGGCVSLIRHLAVRGRLRCAVVVHFDGGLDQLLAVFDGRSLEVGRDLDDVPLGAQLFVAPDQRIHLDQVDDALEIGLGADRQLHDDGLSAEAHPDRVEAEVEIGADLVHLVDEDDARNVVLVGLAPDGFGLRLDAGLPSSSATAPSSTRSERSTSMVKSTWPGVSMMLKRCCLPSRPFQKVVVAADVMVMPRSCSCSIQSMVAAPSWTSPILWDLPV